MSNPYRTKISFVEKIKENTLQMILSSAITTVFGIIFGFFVLNKIVFPVKTLTHFDVRMLEKTYGQCVDTFGMVPSTTLSSSISCSYPDAILTIDGSHYLCTCKR